MAHKMKLIPGLALGLTTTDENGVAWVFNIKERRIAAEKVDQIKQGNPTHRESDVHSFLYG